MAICISNASTLGWGGRQKQKNILEPHEPGSLAYTAVNKNKPSLKQGGLWSLSKSWPLTFTHKVCYAHATLTHDTICTLHLRVTTHLIIINEIWKEVLRAPFKGLSIWSSAYFNTKLSVLRMKSKLKLFGVRFFFFEKKNHRIYYGHNFPSPSSSPGHFLAGLLLASSSFWFCIFMGCSILHDPFFLKKIIISNLTYHHFLLYTQESKCKDFPSWNTAEGA